MNSIMIVAGEASSSLYAQRLLEHWRQNEVAIEAFGIGNQDMVNLGFEALGRSEELAVVGLQEVIQHWPVIRDAFHALVAAAAQRRPRCALLLDYPDFNLRLAKKLKALGIPVVYYISPQLWAWRKGRIKTVQKYVDRMLVVFPFEKDFYQRHHVEVDFVGHPLLDEIERHQWDKTTRHYHRSRYGFNDKTICLGLMPGSRRSEIGRNLLTQVEAARLLCTRFPQVHPALLVAPSLKIDEVKAALPKIDFPLSIIQAPPFDMIQISDLILCASGTATLMVGLMEKPLIIMYRMKPLTAWIAKRLVRNTPYFGMVNLVAGHKIVPELFQDEASPQRLAHELGLLLEQPDYLPKMVESLAEIKVRLGARGATERVAAILKGYLQ